MNSSPLHLTVKSERVGLLKWLQRISDGAVAASWKGLLLELVQHLVDVLQTNPVVPLGFTGCGVCFEMVEGNEEERRSSRSQVCSG